MLAAALVSLAAPAQELSNEELGEVQNRIARFYSNAADGSVMNEVPPKYSIAQGRFDHPNQSLLYVGDDISHPLLRAAQIKGTPEFRKAYCQQVLRVHFPEFECEKPEGMRATIEANDRVEKLIGTWIPQNQLITDLSQLPVQGQTAVPIWSDDYWRTKYGQTSYRYSQRGFFGTYEQAVASYSQPYEWEGLRGLDPNSVMQRLLPWSPAEKYDLSLADESFGLTNQQKAEGRSFRTPAGVVEEWMGLCHGWSAASVMIPPPLHPVTVAGPSDVGVTWYPADVKAMLTLAWGNENTYNNFVGGRCNTRNPSTYPNGRLIQQECFDTNPATLHLALGNLIGKAKLSFNMDATFDYEVWNQPIKSYEFTYFKPTDSSQTSKNWADVAVNYDANFKRGDRFQSPLTRGVRTDAGYDDSKIKKVVGVMTTVVYLVEFTPPLWQPEPQQNAEVRVTYTYDLELENVNGKLVPRGGEWHENTHPDFLWIPKRDTYPRTNFDMVDIGFSGDSQAGETAVKTARQASQYGFPLCQALKVIVGRASDRPDAIRCPIPRQ